MYDFFKAFFNNQDGPAVPKAPIQPQPNQPQPKLESPSPSPEEKTIDQARANIFNQVCSLIKKNKIEIKSDYPGTTFFSINKTDCHVAWKVKALKVGSSEMDLTDSQTKELEALMKDFRVRALEKTLKEIS